VEDLWNKLNKKQLSRLALDRFIITVHQNRARGVTYGKLTRYLRVLVSEVSLLIL